MSKSVITAPTTVTANTDVFEAIAITTPGAYDVKANLVITGTTATTISAQLFANGSAIPEALASTDITASTGVQTLTVLDTLNVIVAPVGSVAKLSLRLNGNATVNAGVMTVERR